MNDIISKSVLKAFIDRQLALTESTAVVMNAKDFFGNIVDNAPTIDEQKIAAEYCQKRNLVMITMESFEVLKAYYNRVNGIGKERR